MCKFNIVANIKATPVKIDLVKAGAKNAYSDHPR